MSNPTLSRDEIARAAVDRTKYGYAVEYVYFNDDPVDRFSFKNHNYLVDMYLDHHPYIVIEKSAQMGASIYAIVTSFLVCDKRGLNTIYFFPTDTDVQEFSKARVRPLIDSSPHLRAVTEKNDSQGLRRINKGFLYFRGMKSTIQMKSVPGDLLVFDELDEVSESSESLADQRLNHSSLKWRLKLSTPTFEGYGIDREFGRSDRRYWHLLCPNCETNGKPTLNVLEDQWPDCVKRISETKAILICRSCGKQLDAQQGVWIARFPKIERIRGYHLCGLYSHFLDLSELMYEWEDGRKREEFMRSKLGIPYTGADTRLTPGMIDACIDRNMPMHVDTRCFMGVDQKGSAMHCVIRKWNRMRGIPEVIKVVQVEKWHEIDHLMQIHDVSLCVVDAVPNQHSARDLAERFPGRVFMCYYDENMRGDYKWIEPSPEDGTKHWEVKVNRTESLDSMVEEIARREVAFPVDVPMQFKTQLRNMGRVNEEDEDGTIKRAIWKRLGEDHYAHANSYSLIAMSRFGTSRTPAVNLIPRATTRNLYARRRYDMGSRY